MRLLNVASLTLLPAVLLAAGCGSKISNPGGPTGVSGTQITYTPAGCNYQVTTPQGTANAVYLPMAPVSATIAPKHVHASFASDPSTSFAVNWKGDPMATLTQLIYSTDQSAVTNATGVGSGVAVQNGHSFDVISSLDQTSVDVHVQEVHVCGLKPSTTYFYKVGNANAWSKVFSLTTAPATGSTTEFKFAVAGDARNDTMTFAKAEAAIQARAPLFQVFSGDAVDLGIIQTEWDLFFEATSGDVLASDVLASIPAMMTDGNHESLAVNYLAQFALPQQSGGGEVPPTATGKPTLKAWYSFDYGNVHFLDLNDSTENGDTITGAEATWMDSDLSHVDRSKTPWIIVIHHQPIYSCDNTHGSDTTLGAAWQPYFDKYQVDLVLNGHVHNYQRSNPVRGSNVNAPAGQGTVYIVSGSVGAPLYGYNANACAFNLLGSTTTNYAMVDVKGNTLTFTAYDLMGGDVQLDSFTLTK